jgi:hypothetical protein
MFAISITVINASSVLYLAVRIGVSLFFSLFRNILRYTLVDYPYVLALYLPMCHCIKYPPVYTAVIWPKKRIHLKRPKPFCYQLNYSRSNPLTPASVTQPVMASILPFLLNTRSLSRSICHCIHANTCICLAVFASVSI